MKQKLLIGIFLVGAVTLVSCKQTPPATNTNTNSMEEETRIARMFPNADKEYVVDSENTKLQWYAQYVIGNKHNGTITVSNGSVAVIDEVVRDGSFTIDMNTITESNDNETFLTHIRSADFFDIEQYPESKLEITSITRPDESKPTSYVVRGDLTIKDKTNEINFPAIITITNGVLTGEAEFTIDRTLWEINYNSGKIFKDLGDKIIEDNIRYKLTLKANLIDEAMMDDTDDSATEDEDEAAMDDEDDSDVEVKGEVIMMEKKGEEKDKDTAAGVKIDNYLKVQE